MEKIQELGAQENERTSCREKKKKKNMRGTGDRC